MRKACKAEGPARAVAAGDSSPGGLEAFISYSHEDEAHRKSLEKHLSILRRNGLLEIWHDRKIVAGSEWKGQIDQHLATSDLILLLVSPAFLHSDYCYDVEMTRALARHDKGEAVVIPIVVRPVALELTPFARLQALPRDAQAITTWANEDEAWVDVARGIKKAADDFQKRKVRGILASPFAPPAAMPPAAPLHREPPAKRAAVEDVYTWLTSYWGPQIEKVSALDKAEALVRDGLTEPTFANIKEAYAWLVSYQGPEFPKAEAVAHAERMVAAGLDQASSSILKDCFSWLTSYARTSKPQALDLAETLIRKGMDSNGLQDMKSKFAWLVSYTGPQLKPGEALRRCLQEFYPDLEVKEAWLPR